MMKKDTFVFRKEWKDAISGLPDEVRLEIYEAIIEYGTTGKSSGLKPMAMLAFNFAKATLDRDVERYEEVKKKRSDAGKKHKGNQYTNKMEQTEQNGTNGTNGTDNVGVYGSSNEDKKKPPKGGKKDAASAAALLESRKEDFYNTLIPFVSKYGKEMVRAFFDYWSEPNKSHTKMRFELERTWDVKRRLKTWAARDNNFNNTSNGRGTINSGSTPESRAQECADIIARLAAEDGGG